MKSSIVPAQITSVEDRIAGSFSLVQIMLLLCCVFLCVLVYSVLPAENTIEGYKLPLIMGIVFTFVVCSLRVRGKLLLQWFAIFLAFLLRPRIYVFNKNSLVYRDVLPMQLTAMPATGTENAMDESLRPNAVDTKRIEHILNDAQLSVRFTFAKGGLRVKATKLSA